MMYILPFCDPSFIPMQQCGVRRKIAQFHFTSWPDHGVPEYAGSLLAYLRRIKAKYRPSKGPLLVHCRLSATIVSCSYQCATENVY